jgi:hypothetical protein
MGSWDGIVLSKSGTASARITYQNYPGELPVIDGAGVVAEKPWYIVDIKGDFITFSGFKVMNSFHRGINITGNFGIIQNSQFTGNQDSCLSADTRSYADNSPWVRATGNQILNNEVWNCELNNINGKIALTGSNAWALSLQMHSQINGIVRGNRVHDNWGEGIGNHQSEGTLIKNNIVYNNYSVGIYNDGGFNSTFDSNIVYHTANSPMMSNVARCMAFSNERLPVTMHDITVTNNILLNCLQGIWYNYNQAGDQWKNVRIINNTIANTKGGYAAIVGINGIGTVIRNNIIYQDYTKGSTGGAFSSFNTAGTTADHNAIYLIGYPPTARVAYWGEANYFSVSAWQSANAVSVFSNITGDPKLANPAGLTAESWKLLAGSPSINAGSSVLAPTTNFFGTTRPAGGEVDIGSDEFIGGGSPPDTQPPTGPIGLVVN